MQMVSSQSLVLTFHNFNSQQIVQVSNFAKWDHKTFYRFRILQSGTTKHFTGFEFCKVGPQKTFYRFRILRSGTTKHFTGFKFNKL